MGLAGAAADQDINCRTVGRCVFGPEIDRELGTLMVRDPNDPRDGDPVPFDQDCGRSFLYARYDPDVSAEGLSALGLGNVEAAHVQAMDKVEHLEEMRKVGRTYAEKVDMTPFQRFTE